MKPYFAHSENKYGQKELLEVHLQKTAAQAKQYASAFREAGTVPEQAGKVFADWFADSAFTTPYTETTGNAYAKFVDAAVHITKAQFRAETTAESDSTDIRFVSTVDALDYAEVGFYITYGDKTVTAKTKKLFFSGKCEISLDYAAVS